MPRILPILAAALALAWRGPAQVYIEIPSNPNSYVQTGNQIPFGASGTFAGGYTYVARIPAADLDPANPVLQDVAFLPEGTGTWRATTIRVAMGHLPPGPACPFFFPTQNGTSLGSFLDLTPRWVGTQNGQLLWNRTAGQWSPLNLMTSGLPPFVWNGTDDVGFYISFQSAQITGQQSGCYQLGTQGPRRYFASGYQASLASLSSTCFSFGGLRMRLAVSCLNPGWQTNQAESSLVLGTNQSTGCGPIEAYACPGVPSSIALASTAAGLPWDLGVNRAAGLPAGGGGITTPGGQLVNLDLSAPLTAFVLGLQFNLPFVPAASNVLLGQPGDLSAQMVNLTPGSGEGFALSALATLHVVAGQPVSLPVMDDGDVLIDLGTTPFCGPPAIPFYGTAYTQIYANCNGFVSFGGSDSNWFAAPNEFATGPARLAGLWTDLTLVGGGTITASATPTTVTVSYIQVPEWTPAGLNLVRWNFDLVFDAGTGSCSILNWTPGTGHGTDSVVGITPGNGATVVSPVGFGAAAGLGVQTGPGPTQMIYEFVAGGAPSGFSSIVFPTSDGSQFIVN